LPTLPAAKTGNVVKEISLRGMERVMTVALAYDVARFCIMPYALKRCAERLGGSTVRASTTIEARRRLALPAINP
jgi:hypothetical protein